MFCDNVFVFDLEIQPGFLNYCLICFCSDKAFYLMNMLKCSYRCGIIRDKL